MLKLPRTAFGRLYVAAVFAFFAAAFWRPATETALRDGVFERSSQRRTTDGGEVWESDGDFNGVFRVKTAKMGVWGAFGSLEMPGDRRDVERFQADFEERLRVGAAEFWASRRSAPGASVALRAVADGWARWNVGPKATARFLETLTATERSAFERRRRAGTAFDFATDRAASAEASKDASAALTALKSEDEENGAEFDGGVDAALAFLQTLDGNEGASENVCGDINNKGESDGETFLWAAAFEGNPLNAVGSLAASDVVAISVPSNLASVRSAFAASATFFFLSTFGAFGGSFPRTWTFFGGDGGENRLEREFWRLLDAAFRRFGVALANWKKLLYFARLALFNAFRRSDVEDGVASKRSLAALCASTRLLI
jgi:hypothetical protein